MVITVILVITVITDGASHLCTVRAQHRLSNNCQRRCHDRTWQSLRR